MIGAKEICALLLAGSMGAGSVVAVQKARPAESRAAVSKPKAAKPQRTAQRQFASVPVLCEESLTGTAVLPLPDFGLSAEEGSTFGPLPSSGTSALPGLLAPPGPGGGGGGFFPGPGFPAPPPAGVIPEPGAWGMMIAGFGLVGLALRRPQGSRAPTERA